MLRKVVSTCITQTRNVDMWITNNFSTTLFKLIVLCYTSIQYHTYKDSMILEVFE